MLSISPATADEREAAYRLAFQHLDRDQQVEKCRHAEEMIRSGELDANAIWLARDGDGIGPAGVMIAAPLPGGGAAVYPPRGRTSLHRSEVVLDPLVQATMSWLRSRGVRLAQVLATAQEVAAAEPLERNGFIRVTRLIYQRHFLDLSFDEIARAERLDYRAVAGLPTSVIENTLLRTYANSLDCPELNVQRSAAEALAGHRGTGASDMSRWWIAFARDEPVAVLLCNATNESSWDIAYLGVAAEARSKGLGRDLVHHALFEAKADDMLTVTLTVDERNHPARELYRKTGFEPFDEKMVYLWTAGA